MGRILVSLAIVRDGEFYLVQAAPDRRMPIMRDGQPATVLPGWTPIAVAPGDNGINVLELQHEGGDRAVWYLDERFHFIGNTVDVLQRATPDPPVPPSNAARLMRHTIWEQLVCAADPVLAPDTLEQWPAIRDAAGLQAPDDDEGLLAPGAVGCLDDASCATVAAALAGQVPNVAASIGYLHQMMARDFFKGLVGASVTGMVQAVSPIDGRLLGTDVGICLRQETIAYRFTDRKHDLTFYLIGSLWRITLAAIYIPRFNLTVHANALQRRHLDEFLGDSIDRALLNHVLAHTHELVAYLAAASRRMTLIYVQNHLGHHLFNELGGLHEIVARIPPGRIPHILLTNAAYSEMYGKVDDIFPELRGNVDRTSRNPEQIRRFVYQNRLCLLRPTDDYVPAALAKRIIDLNETAANLDPDKALFAQLSAAGFTIVTLGLRVENRTVVDQVGFFAEVTDFLRQTFGKVAIVLDGHNAIDGERRATYGSHMEELASRAPALIENDIVQALRGRYAADDDVTLISTVGAPVSASIYWCNRSRLFVTPWGAGLAKYRWVCNRPGLVVSNHRSLRHGGGSALHLYDSDEYMEDPTPLSFIGEDEVRDEPDAPLLVGIPDGNRVNFTVQSEALRVRLAALVQSTGGTVSSDV